MFSLAARLENLAKAETESAFAHDMYNAGMISISVPMLVKVIIEWRKTRVLLTAINVAVRATGKAVLVFAFAAFLIEILWYLLDPDKNAKRILALVLNDTPEDLVVTDWRSGVNGSKSGNLYMRSGYMSRFMEDMLADERKVQIAGRAQKDSAVPRSEPDLDFVAVGLYFANRHMGLAGSEGVMIFTSLDKSLNVACMFAVPYVGENGVKVAFPPPSSQPSAIYDAMYNSRGVESEVFGPQYWAKSRVNDARGGVVAGISYIGTTKAYGDFIAFRGPDERLRVALRPDGGSWQPETLVPMGIADSPALVSFRNKLYCFHQGSQGTYQLWYDVFDGEKWSGDQQVSGTDISGSPGVAVYKDKLYCVHQGGRDNGELWFNVFDGNNWTGDARIMDAGITGSPSLCVYKASFGEALFCLCQGKGYSGELQLRFFDGVVWSYYRNGLNVPGTGISASPSTGVFRNKLYVFHQGSGNNGELWFNAMDTLNRWDGDTRVPDVGMTASPAAIAHGDRIEVFHQGKANDDELWSNSLSANGGWSGDQRIAGFKIIDSPAICFAALPTPHPSVKLADG